MQCTVFRFQFPGTAEAERLPKCLEDCPLVNLFCDVPLQHELDIGEVDSLS